MQAAVEALEAEGDPVGQAQIARVSPLAYRHVNFLGRYTFKLPEAVARTAPAFARPKFRIGLSQSLLQYTVPLARTVQDELVGFL
jgi:hypothetical protein